MQAHIVPDAAAFPAPLMEPVVRQRSIGSAAGSPVVAPIATPPEPAPAVHIAIGRVEVIAAPVAAAASEPDRAPAHPPLSLDAYLAQRGRRR